MRERATSEKPKERNGGFLCRRRGGTDRIDIRLNLLPRRTSTSQDALSRPCAMQIIAAASSEDPAWGEIGGVVVNAEGRGERDDIDWPARFHPSSAGQVIEKVRCFPSPPRRIEDHHGVSAPQYRTGDLAIAMSICPSPDRLNDLSVVDIWHLDMMIAHLHGCHIISDYLLVSKANPFPRAHTISNKMRGIVFAASRNVTTVTDRGHLVPSWLPADVAVRLSIGRETQRPPGFLSPVTSALPPLGDSARFLYVRVCRQYSDWLGGAGAKCRIRHIDPSSQSIWRDSSAIAPWPAALSDAREACESCSSFFVSSLILGWGRHCRDASQA